MENKLKKIFTFLQENRKYNHELQTKCYIADIRSCKTKSEKVFSLLYRIANTQSQPKIDLLSLSYQGFSQDKNCFKSFKNFVNYINPGSEPNLDALYEGMCNQPGWGKKTSALFVKSIFHLHNSQYPSDLVIWNDAPKRITSNNFKLPVDAVILAVIKKIKKKNNKHNWSFISINKLLNDFSSDANDIEVWDDLWFWGFITQRTNGINPRTFEWNENKYWALKETSKDKATIQEIQKLSGKFVKIIG